MFTTTRLPAKPVRAPTHLPTTTDGCTPVAPSNTVAPPTLWKSATEAIHVSHQSSWEL